jgi:hypothetical protein
VGVGCPHTRTSQPPPTANKRPSIRVPHSRKRCPAQVPTVIFHSPLTTSSRPNAGRMGGQRRRPWGAGVGQKEKRGCVSNLQRQRSMHPAPARVRACAGLCLGRPLAPTRMPFVHCVDAVSNEVCVRVTLLCPAPPPHPAAPRHTRPHPQALLRAAAGRTQPPCTRPLLGSPCPSRPLHSGTPSTYPVALLPLLGSGGLGQGGAGAPLPRWWGAVAGAGQRRPMATQPPQDDLRATSILRARLKEPRAPGDKAPSTRQLRVAGMLQDAMSRVLDERVLEDPDLYPRGTPVHVFDVKVSPCLRYAVFMWSVPLRDKVTRPHRYRGRQGAAGAPDPDAIAHLSKADAAVVIRTSAALNRCASRLKQFMLPHIRMKV